MTSGVVSFRHTVDKEFTGLESNSPPFFRAPGLLLASTGALAPSGLLKGGTQIYSLYLHEICPSSFATELAWVFNGGNAPRLNGKVADLNFAFNRHLLMIEGGLLPSIPP